MQNELLNTILSRLSGVKQLGPDRWMAKCPAHHDEHPSLSIKAVEGKVLLHCFAGCKYQDIIRALGIESTKTEEIEDIYEYRDLDNRPLFRKIRFAGKRFVIEHVHENYWVRGQGSAPNVLYRLPEVKNAQKVYIVEGEKDVENLVRFGLVATTNPHGANEPDLRPYVEHLKGKDIVIIPDQDKAGLELARRWTELLFPVANSLKVIYLPHPAKDVSDFLASHSIDELLALEEETTSFSAADIQEEFSEALIRLRLNKIELILTRGKQDAKGYDFWRYHAITPSGSTSSLVALNNLTARRKEAAQLEDYLPTGLWGYLFERAATGISKPKTQVFCLAEAKAEAPSFLLKPFIIADGLNIIFGPGGTMKSLLAIILSKCITNNWLPPGTHDLELYKTGNVLFIDWEDELGPFLDRVRKVGLALDRVFYEKATRPFVEMIPEIKKEVDERDIALIVIDSIGPALGSGNPFSLEAATAFIAATKALGRPVLAIGHPPKHMSDTVYGSVFFENLSRNIFRVEAFLPGNPFSIMELVNKKSSYFDGSNLAYKVSIGFFGTSIEAKIDRISVAPKALAPAILFLLKTYGKMTLRELKNELPTTPEKEIRRELGNLKELGQIEIDDEGKFMLSEKASYDEVPF
jgi:hypothetical protein